MNFIEVAHAGVISDATPISQVGTNILNFLLQVTGIVAIISLLIAGGMYLVFSGDSKKMKMAKNAMQASIVGIVLAMSGMILVKLIGQFFR